MLIVIGVLQRRRQPRPLLLFGGLALVSVAALELAIREHFAGYRSHTTLLAAVVGVGAARRALARRRCRRRCCSSSASSSGVVAFRLLRAAFARRARGLTFRA